MAFNFNGTISQDDHLNISIGNRALNYGDGVFESIRYANKRINFWEDHYFRLMASMRILRMQIPRFFSPEYVEEQIRETLSAADLTKKSARVKVLVFRNDGGLYTPISNDVSFLITVSELDNSKYVFNETGLRVDLFLDYYKSKGLLSSLKSSSSQIFILASIYKQENELDECLILNSDKMLAEAISSNVFVVKGDQVITPPISDGCVKGIMRKNSIKLLQEMNYTVVEQSISPFELQVADEVFLTNAISGIKWVQSYRKKTYTNEMALNLISRLNIKAVLG